MNGKILTWEQLAIRVGDIREQGLKAVFTNGCFDLLHKGHIRYLQEARSMGDALIVGLNTDRSIRSLKGADRPIQPQADRAEILAALGCVDYVTLFDEETPLQLIQCITPDVLVKGGDWPVSQIVGGDVVEKAGGRVFSIPYVAGISTSDIIRKIRGN